MKIQEIDGGAQERRVLTGMIVSTPVSGMVASQWTKEGLFSSPWSNLIGKWSVDYYRKYSKAIGKSIQGIFSTWAEKNHHDQATTDLVERFLSSLSTEYDQARKGINAAYLIDLAGEHFNQVRLRKLHSQLGADLDTGKLDEATKRVTAFSHIEMGGSNGIDLFLNKEKVLANFSGETNTVLVNYDGALGSFFQYALERDGFVSFIGPQKAGKTYMLLDIAWRAMLQRRRVAFFEIGDLSERQTIDRFMIRAAKRPIRNTTQSWPYLLRYPTSISPPVNGNGDCAHVEFRERKFSKPLDGLLAWKACERVMADEVKSDQSYFKLSCHGNESISVLGIRSIIRSWELQGWVPDVVCLSEGSLVLTDRGLVPIESVERYHRLWDGLNWVQHGGRVYKGVKNVIEYQGLRATPDHKVWTEIGWRTLESCSQMGLRIIQTGAGGRNLRLGENHISHDQSENIRIQKIRKNLSGKEGICLCEMCSMRIKEMGHVREYSSRDFQRMPFMHAAQEVSDLAVDEDGEQAATVPKPQKRWLEALWRTWDQVPLFDYYRILPVGLKKYRTKGKDIGNRPDRQRRSLRTGKHTLVHKETELLPYPQESNCPQSASVPAALPSCRICGKYTGEVFSSGHEPKTNNKTLERIQEKTKVPVWDIRNAGPLHRFTVQGVLAHNCIDYADNLMPIDSRAEPRDQVNRTWKHLRTMSMSLHCLLVTATQTNAQGLNRVTLDRSNFSEDNRKLSHVTGLIGINVTSAEKEQGVMRLNWIVLREGEFSPRKCVHVATCLPLADPCVVSCF